MSRIENLTIPSKHDDLPLSVLVVLPDEKPKALVQFAHGMAEHKERYLPFMQFLSEHGCACIINDHRGHGASVLAPDDLGYFYKDGGRALVKDLHQLSLHFRARFPRTPLILFGHSMGSLAARDYAAKYGRDIDGLILTGSPGANPAAKAGLALTAVLSALSPKHRRARSKIMDAMVIGPFSKHFKTSPCAWLSANPENVAAYEADPLCGFSFTLNGYRALLNLMIAAYDPKTTLRRSLPIHFASGEDDPCAPTPAAFHAAVQNARDRGATRVTSTLYPHLRHEILNENAPAVWSDLAAKIEEWVEA